MGIDHHRIYSVAMGIAMVVATIAALYLASAPFRSTIGPARLIYAVRGGDHRRPREPVGYACGRRHYRPRADLRAKLNPEWQILAGHIAFLVVVVLRPRGLFPRAVD